jgi:hypothetical protein
MQSNPTSKEKGRENDHQEASQKALNNVPVCGTDADGYVVNALTCATLIERVVGFMDRYNESWYG